MPTRFDLDPDGRRLPVRFDGTSNGEYVPLPTTERQRLANAMAQEDAGEHARRLGLGRRAFLTSSMGAATVLAACNRANPNSGGNYALPAEASLDKAAAESAIGGSDFIFDVQLHCVDPKAAWTRGAAGEQWRAALGQAFPQSVKCKAGEYDCYSAQALVKDVFLDSDTDAGVVSALFGTDEGNPTPIAYAAQARELVEGLGGGTKRCLIHGGLLPNIPGEIQGMEAKARVHKVSAWKLYPQWGPDGQGYFLDSGPLAEQVFAEARRLGVRTFAVHKGVSLYGQQQELSSPRDMGAAAAKNPDLTFLVYHSGFQPGVKEGAYDPDGGGVDRLIRAHREAGLKRNEGNLYAELGACWRYFMGRPDEAAHVIGKLLATFGEERIMWGTDCLWFGSPQDQIQAFRAFEISTEYQEKFGYPALTPEAKRQIFGLNAARVYGLDVPGIRTSGLEQSRVTYREQANPSFASYGPASRRQFLALHREHGGRPG
ncbi:MAG TPA: amidohydrolase family protein [Sphingomicrobium sp.]